MAQEIISSTVWSIVASTALSATVLLHNKVAHLLRISRIESFENGVMVVD